MLSKGMNPSLVCIEAHPGDLERYVFLGSTNSPAISMVVVLYDASGMRVAKGTLVPTTAVSSLPYLWYFSGDTWPQTAVGGKVISISSGTVYFDVYGDGLIDDESDNLANGLSDTSIYPCTSADMEAISAGFRFGRIARGA